MEFTTDDIRAVGGRRYWRAIKKKVLSAVIICVVGFIVMFSSTFIGGWPATSTYSIESSTKVPVATEDGGFIYEIKRSEGSVYLNGIKMDKVSGSTSSAGRSAMIIIGVIILLSGFGWLIYTMWREGSYKNEFVDEWIKSKQSP